jgi:hypothetical protein
VAVELHWDVVAAARQIFGVQGLVDVADEVQDEFQGFVAGAEGVGGVEEEGGLQSVRSCVDYVACGGEDVSRLTIPGWRGLKSHSPGPVCSLVRNRGCSSQVGCLWRLPLLSHRISCCPDNICSGGDYTASRTNKMPALSKRLAHADRVWPDSRVANIESFRRLQKVLNELGCIFREEVLCQVADGAMAETAPGGCLTCEGEDGKGCWGEHVFGTCYEMEGMDVSVVGDEYIYRM